MNIRILLVEDEDNLRDTIKLNLELEGYHIIAVNNGLDALQYARSERFNLVILDIMLPKMNGLEVCQRLQIENKDIPVLFLSAKNATEDRIAGLKMGAQDYLTKPFNLEELLLRVGILIKTHQKGDFQSEINYITIGNCSIDFQSYEVKTPTGVVSISKKEAMLLKLLYEKKNQVVSREEILEKVWGYDIYINTRTIDNFMLNLRKIFEPNLKEPVFFHSVRGIGYKLNLA